MLSSAFIPAAMLSSLLPASKAMACNSLISGIYWSMVAKGIFAVHFASIIGCNCPLATGRSRNSGGFAGLGDHAAAEARVAFVKKSAFAISSTVCTASNFDIDSVSLGMLNPGVMQQGLNK